MSFNHGDKITLSEDSLYEAFGKYLVQKYKLTEKDSERICMANMVFNAADFSITIEIAEKKKK